MYIVYMMKMAELIKYGKSKAKYVFSIHLNSIEQANTQRGVEIYAPTRVNLDFAKSFADNIVKGANTRYSTIDVPYRTNVEGVFVRTFRESELVKSAEDAEKLGYQMYDVKEYAPYLYMLRETGGIATGAYIDGRNTKFGKNLYYDSNIGVEAYLIEIGYINNRIDLQNILDNQAGYVKGIVDAIKLEIFGESV